MSSLESHRLEASFRAMSARMNAAGGDIDAIRDMVATLEAEAAEPNDVTYAEVDANGHRSLWCYPLGTHRGVVLYFHGGGYIANKPEVVRKVAGHLAKESGIPVLIPTYRLSPEHLYPAALEDAIEAFDWLISQGFKAEEIAVAGESAGGNLALATALWLLRKRKVRVGAVVGFSPWLDLVGSGETFSTNAETDGFLSRGASQLMASMYLGDMTKVDDPFVNPAVSDPEGMPPMFLTAGSAENLLSSIQEYAARASRSGVDVNLEVCDGMQHAHIYMVGRAAEASRTMAAAGAWLRRHLTPVMIPSVHASAHASAAASLGPVATSRTPSTLTTPDNVEIYYKDWGPKDGPVVVFSHGWPLNSDSWDAQMQLLASKGYRTVAHDRRGHGRSTQPWDGNDMDHYASDLATVINTLNLESISLVGFSTGGGEVARYIGRYGTSKVKRTVLISAVPPFMMKDSSNPNGVPGEVFDRMREAHLSNRAELYRDIASGPFYGFNRPGAKASQAMVDSWWRQGMQAGAKNTYDCISAFSATDFRKDLQNFDIPTLVIHGDDDQIVPIDISGRASASLIAGARLIVYPGAPHGLTETHQDRVNQDLLEFMRD